MRTLYENEMTTVAGAGTTYTHEGLTGTTTYTPSPEAAAYMAARKQAMIAKLALLKSMAIKYHQGALACLQGTGKPIVTTTTE